MSDVIEQFYLLKDSDGIDRSFLLTVLDEIKVIFKSGKKSVDSLNPILHELIQISVDIDVNDAQVFIEICDAASLFLHQISKEGNKRKTLPSVCDAFMELIDISNGYEQRTHYRDYILKVSYTPLINIILDQNRERDVELIGIAFKCLNYILTGSSTDLRRQISTENESQIPKIFNLLCQCGDYDVQVSAVETIFRLLPPKEHRKEILCSWLRSYGDEVIHSFLEIQRLSFDVDVRHFLIKVNKLFSTELKVHSIPCLKIEVSGLSLYKPKDEHYDEFWVDFNEGSKCIFVNCLQKEEINASWDALTIKLNSIISINLEKLGLHSQVLIKLKKSARSYFDSVTASAFEGKDVKILFDLKYELSGILQKIFDTKFSIGKFRLHSSPNRVMFDRKKENSFKISASQSNLSKEEQIILVNENTNPNHDILSKHNHKNKTPDNSENLNKKEKSTSSNIQYIKEDPKDKNVTIEPNGSSHITELDISNLNETKKKENINQLVVNEKEKTTLQPQPIYSLYCTKENKTVGDSDFGVIPPEKMPKKRKHTVEKEIKASNKRKLFNQASNFMGAESSKNDKKRSKKSQISKKVDKEKTNFYESTPLCKNKKMSEFPGEMSSIEMTNKNDIKNNLRQKKKVTYIESSEEELVDSHHITISKPKIHKEISTYNIPSNSTVFDFNNIGLESPVLKVNKSKALTYGGPRKALPYKKKVIEENDENNNTVLEPELLRDDSKLHQAHDIVESPEVSLKELKRSKNKKKKNISVNFSRLPEFQPSGEEIDTNKDSGISTGKSMSSPQESQVPFPIQSCSPKKSLNTNILCNDTKLILDKIDSLGATYQIKTECLENLIILKASFVSSIDSMITKLKHNL